MKHTFESANTGREVEISFPAAYVVCSDCRGEGRTLRAGLRGMMTSEDFEDMGDEGQEAYFNSSSHYHETCNTCGGQRVTLEVDREACTRDRRLRRFLALLDSEQHAAAQWDAEARAEQRRESMMLGEDY